MIVALGAVNLDLVVGITAMPMTGGRAHTGRIRRRAGGMAANAAAAAAGFGADVALMGAVGPDPDGRWLLEGLEAAGVDVSEVRTDGWTSVAIVLVSTDGQRTVISEDDAVCETDLEHALGRLTGGDDLLYLDGYRWPWAAEVLAGSPPGGMVVVDADGLQDRSALEGLCRVATHVLCSRTHWSGLVGYEEPDAFAESLAFELATTIVLTDGAAGWWLTDGRRQMSGSGLPVTAVDTTGAGDVFAGVFCAALDAGSEIEEAAAVANAAAGLSTTRPGARDWLPTRPAIMEVLAQPANGLEIKPAHHPHMINEA